MATKQRCPKCNQLNDLSARRCVRCGAPLIQVCPICGTPRPWYVGHCPNCEGQSTNDVLLADLFREAPHQELAHRYRLLSTLSKGPISTVYKAADLHSEKLYAIKELSPLALITSKERREAVATFERSLTLWREVNHPGFVRIVDAFHEHNNYYVVYEFLEGWTLAKIIANPSWKTPPSLACAWGIQLGEALCYLHRQSPPLFASFLSPSHVLITIEGRAKILGFNLGQAFKPTANLPYGSVPGYSAPELQTAPPTPQSDLFALGRLLYALLIDKLLEKGLPHKLPLQQAVPGIAKELVKAIAKAAHKDVARRFASVEEFLQVLSKYAARSTSNWLVTLQRAAEKHLLEKETLPPEPMAAFGFRRDPRFGPTPTAEAAVPSLKPKGKLSVYPRQIRLVDVPPTGKKRFALRLYNAGQGELTGRIISHTSWITTPQKAFRLPPGKQAKALLSIKLNELPAGHIIEPQAISIDTDTGRQWVGVTVDIPTTPLLHVEPTLLDFGPVEANTERTLQLKVSNLGRQSLSGQVTSSLPWIRLGKHQFQCAAGQTTILPVTAIPSKMPKGTFAEPQGLLIDSDGGQKRIEIRAQRRIPELDVGTLTIDFGTVLAGQVSERYLYIGNTGNAPLHGAARSLLPWLQVHPQRFSCAPGELAQLVLSADWTGLADGPLEIPQALRLQTNGGSKTLSLRAQISAPKLVLESSFLECGTLSLGEEKEIALSLRNEGSAPLKAQLRSLVQWLIVPTEHIQCAPGERKQIPLLASSKVFDHGEEISSQAAIRLVAGAEIYDIPAHITIIQPALAVAPLEMDFGYVDRTRPESRNLTISNQGTGNLEWHIQTDALWLEISPLSGNCQAGQSCLVQLTAYGLALESESATATLIVNSDGGRAKIPLRIALASPLLATDTLFLDLGTSVNRENVSNVLRIFNHGLGMLRGNITTDQTWLTVDKVSFACPTGRSVQVHVSTDMEEFPQGTSEGRGSIHITSNGGEVDVKVSLALQLEPELKLPQELVLKPKADVLQGRLLLYNTGLAPAHVEITPSVPQLMLSRNVCDIKPQKSSRLTVRFQIGDDSNIEQDQLYLEIFMGERSFRLPVRPEPF